MYSDRSFFLGFLVLVLVAPLVKASPELPLDVAILYNDWEHFDNLPSGLAQYNDFDAIDTYHLSTIPSFSLLASYDAVVMTQSSFPEYYQERWGNVLADYADAGGGVVLGFGCLYSGPSSNPGRITDEDHSPFSYLGDRLPLTTLEEDSSQPPHPLMENVNTLETEYCYDISVRSGANVVSYFENGEPVAGYMDTERGRVVAVQGFYSEDPYFINQGDFIQLYRNAIVYSVVSSVPEPGTLALLSIGALVVIRRRGVE